MKYTLAFVKECKAEYLWYKDELKELMTRHGLSEYYDTKIDVVNMYRWYPEEVFKVLEK